MHIYWMQLPQTLNKQVEIVEAFQNWNQKLKPYYNTNKYLLNYDLL